MPILIRGRCYKKFKGATRAVMKWKRIGKVRASAYVAAVERKQRGTRTLREACGRGRYGHGGRARRSSRRRSSRTRSGRNVGRCLKWAAYGGRCLKRAKYRRRSRSRSRSRR